MIIQHNLSAMNAWRQVGINNRGTSKNLETLASGFKINRAGDDAAGLGISEKMRGQIRGTMMGTQNTHMGINLVQTAEGALNETHAILQRMRELAVQSSNGTYQDVVDRENLEKEYQALKNEVDRIAESTHYNGIKLLDGSLDNKQTIPVAIYSVSPKATQHATHIIDTATQTITIAGDGAFDLSGYSGYTVNISGGNVLLTHTDGIQLQDVTINCAEETNLFIDSLDINLTQDKNAIRFEGQSNTLNLIGTNSITRSSPSSTYTALIRTGSNTELMINEASGFSGALNLSDVNTGNYRQGAVIGGDNDESGGSITIAGGNIHAFASTSRGVVCAAVIGAGASPASASPTNITILSGTIYAEAEWTSTSASVGAYGAAIGGGNLSGPVTIDIYGGDITAIINSKDNDFGSAIGSGDSYYRTTINIYGGDITADVSDGEGLYSSAIGSGSTSAGADINIYGGDINTNGGKIGSYGYDINFPTSIIKIIDDSIKISDLENEIIGRLVYEKSSDKLLIIHYGANSPDNLKIGIADMRTKALDIDVTSISTIDFANNAISNLDNAINLVSKERAHIGAFQNRLESIVRDNGVKTENLQAAESSIRDVDMAKEMMAFTKNNILAQAAQSMLAQANQLPQGVLSLLR